MFWFVRFCYRVILFSLIFVKRVSPMKFSVPVENILKFNRKTAFKVLLGSVNVKGGLINPYIAMKDIHSFDLTLVYEKFR